MSVEKLRFYVHELETEIESQLLPPANEVCEVYVFTGVYLSTGEWGLCPGGPLSKMGGSLSWGGGLCLGGSLSKMGGLCPGEEVSVRGGSLSREGVSVKRDPPYSYVRAVRILLECILVWLMFLLRHIFFVRKDIQKNI